MNSSGIIANDKSRRSSDYVIPFGIRPLPNWMAQGLLDTRFHLKPVLADCGTVLRQRIANVRLRGA